MTPEQFAYWMQGFAELNALPPSPEQWQSIREHLALVFEKKTLEFQPNRVPDLQRDLMRAMGPGIATGGVLKC